MVRFAAPLALDGSSHHGESDQPTAGSDDGPRSPVQIYRGNKVKEQSVHQLLTHRLNASHANQLAGAADLVVAQPATAAPAQMDGTAKCVQSTEQIVQDISVLLQADTASVDSLCARYCEQYDADSIPYQVYTLLSLLYTSSTPQLPHVHVTDDNIEVVRQFYVKGAVSEWLGQLCSGCMQDINQSSVSSNVLTHTLYLLLCHRVSEACDVLTQHIAEYDDLLLLVSQIGQSYTTQRDVALQLRQWTVDGTAQRMVREHILIYKLIAGDVAGVASTLAQQYNLSWLHILALFLWYNASAMYGTISDGMAAYTDWWRQHTDVPQCTPLSRYSIQHGDQVLDIVYSILALYCNTDTALNEELYQQILQPTAYSMQPHDYHLAYHVHQVYTLLRDDSTDAVSRALALRYCEQLETLNLWHLALHIAARHHLYTERGALLHRYIQQLQLPVDHALLNTICTHIQYTQYDTCIQAVRNADKHSQSAHVDTNLIEFICNAAEIDVERLYELKADHTLRSAQHSTPIDHTLYCMAYVLYLRGERYVAAHDVMLQHVLPPLILAQQWPAMHTEAQRLQRTLSHTVYDHGIGLYVQAHQVLHAAHIIDVQNLSSQLHQLQHRLHASLPPTANIVAVAAQQYIIQQLQRIAVQMDSVDAARVTEDDGRGMSGMLLDAYVRGALQSN